MQFIQQKLFLPKNLLALKKLVPLFFISQQNRKFIGIRYDATIFRFRICKYREQCSIRQWISEYLKKVGQVSSVRINRIILGVRKHRHKGSLNRIKRCFLDHSRSWKSSKFFSIDIFLYFFLLLFPYSFPFFFRSMDIHRHRKNKK